MEIVKLRRSKPIKPEKASSQKKTRLRRINDSPIRLETWINKHYITKRAFAKAIGVCHESLSQWFVGKCLPHPKYIVAIYHLTKKKFSPNYWYLQLPLEIEKKNRLLPCEKRQKLVMVATNRIKKRKSKKRGKYAPRKPKTPFQDLDEGEVVVVSSPETSLTTS